MELDYESLPTVVDPEAASRGEVLLFPESGTNVALHQKGDEDGPEDDRGHEVVVRGRFANQRVAPAPLEGQAGAAHWARTTG